MSDHPVPWKLVEKERCGEEYLDIVDANGNSVIEISSPCREEGSNIRAHSDDLHNIVRSVNLHDELVEALEDAKRFIPDHPADTVVGGREKLIEIDALLAKAKGEA